MNLLDRLPRSKVSPALRERLARWRADRMQFREQMIILEDGRRLGEVMDTWQREDFAALDDPRHRHAYLERPRGHSKTGDAGTEAVTELVCGANNQRLYCVASDEDQARILYDDVVGKLARNPSLAPLVNIKQREVHCTLTGSRLTLLNADVASSWGLRPDWIAIDEIVEWRERGRDLWNSFWTATGKRPRCRVICISTAGWDKSSLAWQVREMAEAESDWLLSARGQCAHWVRPAWLEQQKRTLPAHVYARLHESRWVDGVGAFLSAAEVDGIFTGIPSEGNGATALGLDIGLTRDRTVLAVVRKLDGLIVVLHLVAWQGRPGKKVDLDEVESEVRALAQRYGAAVHFDPFQGVQMGQRLVRAGVQAREYTFTGESRRRLFSLMLDLVRTGRLRASPHAELRRELLGLEASESAAGWRIDHRPGQHDDFVIAVALAAQAVAGGTQEIQLSDWLEIRSFPREEILAQASARYENSAVLGLAPWSSRGGVSVGRDDADDVEYKQRELEKWKQRKNLR